MVVLVPFAENGVELVHGHRMHGRHVGGRCKLPEVARVRAEYPRLSAVVNENLRHAVQDALVLDRPMVSGSAADWNLIKKLVEHFFSPELVEVGADRLPWVSNVLQKKGCVNSAQKNLTSAYSLRTKGAR